MTARARTAWTFVITGLAPAVWVGAAAVAVAAAAVLVIPRRRSAGAVESVDLGRPAERRETAREVTVAF